uniref:MMS19 nucleotide excision repair protein n=1 Tax=Mastigamoeba balamuthi TaxID=108607 RepID=M9WJR7_MASBA|nr:cytosolic Fe-S cluster assembling factor MMS19 [Mastigamoeba balamuthi]
MDYASVVEEFCARPARTQTHIENIAAVCQRTREAGASEFNALVGATAPELASEDDARRGRADLATVFSDSAAVAVTRFFVDRLEDQPCMTEVLRGVRAATSGFGPRGLAAPGLAEQAASLLAANFRAQTHTQATRLQACDRDSRNLVAVLGLVERALRKAAQERSLGADDARAAFDVVSTFFPVLYVPHIPPGTGSGKCVAQWSRTLSVFPRFLSFVLFFRWPLTLRARRPATKEEVQVALRACMSACPQTAEMSLVFLLDRTESAISAARIDAFITAAACFRVASDDVVRAEGTALAWWHAARDHALDTPSGALGASRGATEWVAEAVDFLARACSAPPPDPDDEEVGDEVIDAARAMTAELAMSPALGLEVASKVVPHLCRVIETAESLEKPEVGETKKSLSLIAAALANSESTGDAIRAALLASSKALLHAKVYDAAAVAVASCLTDAEASEVLDNLTAAGAAEAIEKLAHKRPQLVAKSGVPRLPLTALPVVAKAGGVVFERAVEAAEASGNVSLLCEVVLAGDAAARATCVQGVLPRLLSRPLADAAAVAAARKISTAVTGALSDAEQVPAILCACSKENAALVAELSFKTIVPAALAASARDDPAAEAMAIVLNKLPEGAAVDGVVSQTLASGSSVALAHVARALLLRSHAAGTQVASALCARCTAGDALAANCVDVLARPPQPAELVVSEGFAERVFSALYEPLAAGLQGSVRNVPHPLRNALARVVSFAPPMALKAPCVAIITLMIDEAASGSKDVDVEAALSAAGNFAKAPSGMNISVVCMRIAALTARHPTARVRAAGLDALLRLRKELPESQSLVFHKEVADAIVPALDDPKRAVRHRAVRCRNAWLSYN